MKRLAIYAHWDGHGRAKPYVLHYLEQLAKECARLEFVTTGDLDETELDKVRRFADAAETRPNVGFDFGMWQHALSRIDLTAWDEIVLTNSSMFGPVFPLAEMFGAMAEVDVDFWGATDNEEMAWHIQSYFLVFRRRALDAEAFTRFWKSVLPYKNKDQVIRAYEVGLSEYLGQEGLRGRAYIPVSTLFPPWPLALGYKNRRRSATTFHPMRLIDRRMPFVKADTLRDNPGNVPLEPIYEAMRRAGYDTSMIRFDRPAPDRSLGTRVRKLLEIP